MPLLKMDENGQIYEAASHRSDGTGVERLPQKVRSFGDVTYDNTYRRAEIERQKEWKKLAAFNKECDLNRAHELMHERKRRQEEARLEEQKRFYENHPEFKKQLRVEAIQKGLNGFGVLPTGLSGNGMTANGRTGEAGKSLEQRQIKSAHMEQYFAKQGKGNMPIAREIPSVSLEEMEQHRYRKFVDTVKVQQSEHAQRIERANKDHLKNLSNRHPVPNKKTVLER